MHLKYDLKNKHDLRNKITFIYVKILVYLDIISMNSFLIILTASNIFHSEII